jgi:hypothetical protein
MLPAEAVREVLSRNTLSLVDARTPARRGPIQGEIQVFHALVRWAKCGDGGGRFEGGGAGGGGESKEGDQEEGREAQFVDLLGRCVRAPLLSSDDLAWVVLREPLVENSFAAFRMMTRVLQRRAVDSAEHAAQFASPMSLCRLRRGRRPRGGGGGGEEKTARKSEDSRLAGGADLFAGGGGDDY